MAFGSPAAERAAIESTYEDTATVYRTAPKRGANGLSASVPDVVYSGIICALSYASIDLQVEKEKKEQKRAAARRGKKGR